VELAARVWGSSPLVKLAGRDAQNDQSKGSSTLTAVEVRPRIDALTPPAGGAGRSEGGSDPNQAAVSGSDPDDDQNGLFGDNGGGAAFGNSAPAGNDYDDTSFDDAWGDYRGWLNAL